jgi:hypothetical protein
VHFAETASLRVSLLEVIRMQVFVSGGWAAFWRWCWMGLQADYDLEEARRRLGARLEREVHKRTA